MITPSQKGKVVSKRIALLGASVAAIALFFYFIWPTPFEYFRVGTNLFRVNRFSGTKEESGDEGWIDLAAEHKKSRKLEEDAEKLEAEAERKRKTDQAVIEQQERDIERAKQKEDAQRLEPKALPSTFAGSIKMHTDARCTITFRKGIVYRFLVKATKAIKSTREGYFLITFRDSGSLEVAHDTVQLTSMINGETDYYFDGNVSFVSSDDYDRIATFDVATTVPTLLAP